MFEMNCQCNIGLVIGGCPGVGCEMELPFMFLYAVLAFLNSFWNNHLHVTRMRYVAANVQRLNERHTRLLWEMVSNILVILFSLNS